MRAFLNLAHDWGWAASVISAAFFLFSATDSNTKAIAALQAQSLPERMAAREQAAKDTDLRLSRIEELEGKIFDRINQIADRK